MDAIGVLDTDPALSVFVEYLRDQADKYVGSLDVHIGITINNIADGIEAKIVN